MLGRAPFFALPSFLPQVLHSPFVESKGHLVLISDHHVMVHSSEAEADAKDFKLGVAPVWQVPQVHKLGVERLRVHLVGRQGERAKWAPGGVGVP